MRLYSLLFLLIIECGFSLRIRSLTPVTNRNKIFGSFQFDSNSHSADATTPFLSSVNNRQIEFPERRKNLNENHSHNNNNNNSIQKYFKRFLSTVVISAAFFSSGNIDFNNFNVNNNNILDAISSSNRMSTSHNSNSFNSNSNDNNNNYNDNNQHASPLFIASVRADDELANYAAQGNDVGVDGQCFIKKCGFETSGCANEPTCLKGLACLARCKGGSLCSTGCFAKYGSKSLDNLLYCSVEKNDCVRVPGKESLGWTIDTLKDLPFKPSRTFDMAAMQGTWYKVMGLDSRYDCFDCQKNKFDIKNKNTLKMEALFRIPRPTFPGYLQSKISEELQLAAKDGSYFLSHMQSKGQMFGLTFWENWYVVSDDAKNNKDKKDDIKTDLVAVQQQMYKYQQQPIPMLSLVQPPSFLTTTAKAAKTAASTSTTTSPLAVPFNTALFNLQAATTIPNSNTNNNNINNRNNNSNNDNGNKNINDSVDSVDTIDADTTLSFGSITTTASTASTPAKVTISTINSMDIPSVQATTTTTAQSTNALSFSSSSSSPPITTAVTTSSPSSSSSSKETSSSSSKMLLQSTPQSSTQSQSAVDATTAAMDVGVVQDGDYLPVGDLKLVYYTGHTLQGSYKGAFVLSRSPVVSPAVFNSASRLIRSANLNPDNFCMIRNQCFLSDNTSGSGSNKRASGSGSSMTNNNNNNNNNKNSNNKNNNFLSGIAEDDAYENVEDTNLPFWFIGQKFFKATNNIASELADWFEDPALLSDWLVGQQQRVILENPLAVSPFADLIQENKKY